MDETDFYSYHIRKIPEKQYAAGGGRSTVNDNGRYRGKYLYPGGSFIRFYRRITGKIQTGFQFICHRRDAAQGNCGFSGDK